MEIPRTKATQIAAMNMDGSSIDEIAAVTGIDEETVAAFVAERNAKNGKKPADKQHEQEEKQTESKAYHRLSLSEKFDLIAAAKADPRLSLKELAERFRVTPSTVSSTLRTAGVRVKGMRYGSDSSAKENEPAAAATATSSKDKISHEDNSTKLSKCQALMEDIRKDLIMIYEGMSEQEQRAFDLGEIFGKLNRAEGGLSDV